MIKLNTVLVVVDPTVERDFVIERAISIAKTTNAQITLFINQALLIAPQSYAYEGIDGKFFEAQQKLLEQHYHETLRTVQQEMASAGILSSIEFGNKHNLADAISDKAKSADYDLVIKSTHHYGIIDRYLLTNTDWRLIRTCPIPLLLVKPYPWKPNGSIVVAVDPMHPKAEQSALDQRLLETAEALALQFKQTPHVFHSYFPFDRAYFPLSGRSAETIASLKRQHSEQLTKLLSGYKIQEENIHLSSGELVPALLQTIKLADANLLIIGALSRTILERALIGSTAEKILEQCPCDVLIEKPINQKLGEE